EATGGRALVLLGEIEDKEGDPDAAVATLRRAADLFEVLGDDGGRGEALRQMGVVDLKQGRMEDAERSVRSALDAFAACEDGRGQAWAQQNLAWIAFVTGRLNDADDRLQRSVSMFSELGDTRGMAWSLGLLAFVRMQQARLEEAEALGQQILHEARTTGDRWATGMMLVLLASVRLWTGRTDEAIERATEACQLFSEIGDAFGETQAGAVKGRSLAMVGRIPEAFEAMEEALAAATRGSAREMASIALMSWVATAVQVGDPGRADPALSGLEGIGGVAGSEGLIALGMHALQVGDLDRARSLMQEAAPDLDAAGPGVLAGLALLGAADGGDTVPELAARVAASGSATYLDLTFVDLAAALVAARRDDADEADRLLDASRTRVDATGDRLLSALVRLAAGAVHQRLGRSGDDQAVTDARERLAGFGTSAEGWTRVFELATGSALVD
ncbi:MAG: hypothetical protein JWM05_3600, partial [Acidimicrobiales bacterium]|nr:hypothetical protein [Acidimicrobiales bacterium]